MTDLQNYDVLNVLGFTGSNRWLLYDDRFKKFFSFIGEHCAVTDILTEQEVLEQNELLRCGVYLTEPKLRERIQHLDSEYPGLMACSKADVVKLTSETTLLEQAVNTYEDLLIDMRVTNNKITITDLEDNINELANDEQTQLADCQAKAKQLEELQRDNLRLCCEATKCYTHTHSPALFMHQMPLDQYWVKCDSFLQHFTLYIKDHFKIHEDGELDKSDIENHEIMVKMQSLHKSIKHYTLECIKEKAKVRATQFLIDNMDSSKMHVVNLADMERETEELRLLNEHHLNSDILLHDLDAIVGQQTQQCVELVLVENTKLKMGRATRRYEGANRLAKIISDSLLNAELLWIAIQLDMEKKRNRLDTTEQLQAESMSCMRRIAKMQQLANPAKEGDSIMDRLLSAMAECLNVAKVDMNTCLSAYGKSCHMFNCNLQAMLQRKAHRPALDNLRNLIRLEEVLTPYVYDSPVARPMFVAVGLLQPIFRARMQKEHIESTLRHLRCQFQEFTERMEKEKFWRCGQLLWIWFLTEPKRVLQAIEEVKLAAAKVSTMTDVKALGGIKRK